MATKEKVKQGKHLTVTIRSDGSVDLKWNWDALLREVQIATSDRKVQYVDIGDLAPEEAATLMKTVEAKVKKTRSKATEKKPTVKKTTIAKKSAKQFYNAGLAQLVEQLTCNEKVVSSIPTTSTKFIASGLITVPGFFSIRPMMIKKPRHRTELEITTEECTKVIPNKYEMILMAAARARELERGAKPMIEADNKHCVTAMKELAAGLVDRDIIHRVKK